MEGTEKQGRECRKKKRMTEMIKNWLCTGGQVHLGPINDHFISLQLCNNEGTDDECDVEPRGEKTKKRNETRSEKPVDRESR